MLERPHTNKVHVKVLPTFETDPDSDKDYYVSLELNHLECQLTGENFVRVARKALHSALQGGKISVYNDGVLREAEPSQGPISHHFMHMRLSPEEIVLTPVRRLATPDGKSLTEFSSDSRISPTSI